MLFDLILDDQHPANPHHRGLFELTRTITVLVCRRRDGVVVLRVRLCIYISSRERSVPLVHVLI
jgi:hypothetical protein